MRAEPLDELLSGRRGRTRVGSVQPVDAAPLTGECQRLIDIESGWVDGDAVSARRDADDAARQTVFTLEAGSLFTQ